MHGIENFCIKNASAFEIESGNSYDVIITNPPFGGRQRKSINNSPTQMKFIEFIMEKLNKEGEAVVVIDNGFLTKTDKSSVSIRKRMLENFNLKHIINLPDNTFKDAGATVSTSILHFIKSGRTEKIRIFDLTHLKITKKNPLSLDQLSPVSRAIISGEGFEGEFLILSEDFGDDYIIRTKKSENNDDLYNSKSLVQIIFNTNRRLKDKFLSLERIMND